MKNIKNSLFLGALSVAALTSCVSENVELKDGKEKGTMELSVDIAQPSSRALTDVSNFPVIIYDSKGDRVFSYNTVMDVPAKITTNVGNYRVESHTPGVIQKKMTYPYYQGSTDVEVLEGITSKVDVICKMQNSIIAVNYGQDFTDALSSWEITLNDGSGTALSFKDTDSKDPVYWYFGEDGVQQLKVNFRGTANDGTEVSAPEYTLTKDQADESYDDDRTNFSGGDYLKINLTPVEKEPGKITTITINANVTFTETGETVNVVVVDKPADSGQGDEPGPGSDKITLNLPQDMTVNAATDKSLGDTYIKCEDGIKSIKVNIQSSSDEMMESLEDLSDGYGVDFINGAEIVGNDDLIQLFDDLNQPLTVPTQGDIDYTFPIGNFFGLLAFLSGEHTFYMTVEDMNGNKKSGVLVLTVE